VFDLTVEFTELPPRELACRNTDERRYVVSESSAYRILKAADLITSPACNMPVLSEVEDPEKGDGAS
jgi:putative transposase